VNGTLWPLGDQRLRHSTVPVPLGHFVIPEALAVPHDVSSPRGLGARTRDFHQRYIDLYEGR